MQQSRYADLIREFEMAFFGLFKSKQDRDMDNMLMRLNDTIFPGGETDVLRDIERVSRYTHGKIPRDKIRGFVSGCKTLALISDTREDEDFVRSFKTRSGNLISDAEAYEVFVYFSGESEYANNATRVLGSPLNAEMKQHLAQMEAIYAEGTYEDSITGGYGEFGLTVTNPIPMISVRGSNKYLSKLYFRGQEVKNTRSGSTSSPVTKGKLDIYALSVNGKEVGTIYICPYHRRNCKTAPDGFAFTKEAQMSNSFSQEQKRQMHELVKQLETETVQTTRSRIAENFRAVTKLLQENPKALDAADAEMKHLESLLAQKAQLKSKRESAGQ